MAITAETMVTVRWNQLSTPRSGSEHSQIRDQIAKLGQPGRKGQCSAGKKASTVCLSSPVDVPPVFRTRALSTPMGAGRRRMPHLGHKKGQTW